MKQLSRLLCTAGLLCLSMAAWLTLDNTTLAQDTNTLHPDFPLLDTDGVNVLESGNPISTMQTCGSCHDTAFIAEHSVHTDSGMSLTGTIEEERAWVDGIGWYGGWNPIVYEDVNADIETWLQTSGWRHVGGGAAEAAGVEMNCFLCHIADADNEARVSALAAGNFTWASTATLNQTAIVEADGDTWQFNQDAFTDEGELRAEFINIAAPQDVSCGFCHGTVDTSAQIPLVFDPFDTTQWTTLSTGQIFSPERISNSGMNIDEKTTLSRSWDIHAERVVNCIDCHYSLNNPIFYVEPEDSRPAHLAFDPRRMDYDDFLLRPLHQFANGGLAYADAFPVFERGVRDCASCHDATAAHDWLEYTERHLNALACESCHIPQLFAPALSSVDWTVLTTGGDAHLSYRGMDTGVDPPYLTGYQPVLLADAEKRLTPYNIVTAWYWVYDDPAQPVALEDLQAVYLENDDYAAGVVAVFDVNDDSMLDDSELVLDSDEKVAFIREQLAERGLENPRIFSESQSYALHHNVTHGKWATSDCSTCHTENSRLSQSFLLSAHFPGAVQPALLSENLVGDISLSDDGILHFTPSLDTGENGLYILGHHSSSAVDTIGVLIFIVSMLAVMLHAGLRVLAARRAPAPHDPALREVYMYSIYERQWHWLQTVVIFGLIFTGMVIHKPDMFGMFSFRGVVLVHNALALLLIINAALAAFYHLVSGEIKQFLPEPRGFFGQMFAQARYYAYGIFKGEAHPYEKTRNRKMNPIQQLTYFGLLNVLLPLQVITGTLMWGAQHFPTVTEFVGGLPLLGPVHTLGSWLLATFIVVHVYMTTTGHTPLANIRAMIFGWDEVEVHMTGTENQ